MIFDLQKASILKRASAFLLDLILIAIVAVFFAYLLSLVTGYNDYSKQYNERRAYYLAEYDIEENISQEEYDKLPEEKKEDYKKASEALSKDKVAVKSYNMVVNLSILITSLSIFFAFILLEFILPIVFKNGQTVGKKIFSIALMRSNGVKIGNISLFIRSILGKYAIETMIPVYFLIMLFFGRLDALGAILLFAIPLVNIIILLVTSSHSAVHDLLADTVAVDMSCQKIFDSEADLIAYKEELHRQQAEKADYRV